MSVRRIELRFIAGHRADYAPGRDASAPDAALRNMIAEADGPFAHSLAFRMNDGSLVVAKPKAG